MRQHGQAFPHRAGKKKPTIAEAWIDHGGTSVVVVWKADASQATRTGLPVEVAQLTTMAELSGEARHSALQSIRSGSGWYPRRRGR